MKNYKYIVKFHHDENKNHKCYRTYKEISEDINLPYHVVRELHKNCDGYIERKYLHEKLKRLVTQVKIQTLYNAINNAV